jgi:hypothetical protein
MQGTGGVLSRDETIITTREAQAATLARCGDGADRPGLRTCYVLYAVG